MEKYEATISGGIRGRISWNDEQPHIARQQSTKVQYEMRYGVNTIIKVMRQ